MVSKPWKGLLCEGDIGGEESPALLYGLGCAVASRVAAMMTRRRRRSAVDSSDDDDDAPSPPTYVPPGKSFSSSDPVNNVAVAESRVRKVIVRSIAGLGMVTGFVGIVWAGHLYLSALVVLIQVRRSLFLLSACTCCSYVALPSALFRYFLSRDRGRIVPLLPLHCLAASLLLFLRTPRIRSRTAPPSCCNRA